MKAIKEVLLAAQDYELRYGRKANKVLLNTETWNAVRTEVYELNGLAYDIKHADAIHKDVLYMGGFEVQHDARTAIDIRLEY